MSVPSLFTTFKVNQFNFLPFMIDTGASVSIFPLKLSTNLTVQTSVVTLSSVEGRSVAVHGESYMTISSKDLRRSYNFSFVIADVHTPILGADFLSNHKLSVSCAKRQLVDEVTGLTSSCSPQSTSASSPYVVVRTRDYLMV